MMHEGKIVLLILLTPQKQQLSFHIVSNENKFLFEHYVNNPLKYVFNFKIYSKEYSSNKIYCFYVEFYMNKSRNWEKYARYKSSDRKEVEIKFGFLSKICTGRAKLDL